MSRENTPLDEFSSRLKEAIKSSGLSQREFSELIDIAPQALTKYLNGRVPGGEILRRMAVTLNISADHLLCISQKGDSWEERALTAERKLEQLKVACSTLGKHVSDLGETVRDFTKIISD